MKTPKKSIIIKLGRLSPINTLTLVAALAVPVVTASAQTLWIGGTSDYNVPGSWNPAGVPSGGANASNDSGSNNVVLIQSGDPVWQHGDTLAGNGAGTSGAYLQTGSTNNTGGGNWLRMGVGAGSYGSYILSNGAVRVGGRTQIGENGVGYVEIDGGTYNGNVNDGGANPAMVCGQGDFGPGTGTLVINGGTVTYGRETWIGQNGGSIGTGYLFMNGGILNVNDWFVFGRGGGAGGAHGSGVMTGGTINFTGGGQFLIGGGGVGSLAQSGGTINAFNQYLVPQSDGGGGGSGTNILSGNAVLNAHSWLAVGRNGGRGIMNISGNAVITRDSASDGGSHFDVGAGGIGTLNQNGGTITNVTSDFWLGENATGTWNMNGGLAVLNFLRMTVTGSGGSDLELNGGVIQLAGIIVGSSSGVSILNFNGGTLRATADNAGFISGLSFVTVSPGGAIIDSQTYNIIISQALTDAGGGLTKNGSGTLALTGANGYSGPTLVNGGTLAVQTDSTGNGDYTVANGAQLSVKVLALDNQLNTVNATFTGPATTLNFDLGSFGIPSAAPLNVTGALNVNGTVTVNVASIASQVSQYPLVKYTSKTGSGVFVSGPLPLGVSGFLSNNIANSSIDLVITSVNVPRWEGLAGGTWDLSGTTNWINIGTGLPTSFGNGNVALFNDLAAGFGTVNLIATVIPASVTFNNNSLPYMLVGTGKISGNIGLSKQGSGIASILNTGGNNYTGPTVISGGILAVTNLANGGSASAIGASPADATNLVLDGGTLSYAGPAVAINRGYLTQQTNSAITTVTNLTLSGSVNATLLGGLTKSGDGRLTYAGSGTNVLSGTGSPGYTIQAGSVLFDGSNGGQTNQIGNGLSVVGATGAASVVITNATVTTTGDVSLGNVPSTIGTLTLNNGATLNVGSWFTLSDSPGSSGTATMNSGSTLNVNNGRLFLCSAPGTIDTFNINGGVINKSGDYFAVVNGGWNGVGARTGVVNQVNGIINSSSEMWVGDGGGAGNGSLGIYNLSGGTLTVNNWFGVGRDGSTGIFNMMGGTFNKGSGGDMVIGRGGSTGIFTMSGGTINKDAGNPIIIGQGLGAGEFDQSGGTLNTSAEYWVGVDNGTFATNNIGGSSSLNLSNWLSLGRGGNAFVTFSGGQIYKSGNGNFIVGDGGTATFTQTGGTNNTDAEVWIAQSGSGVGEYDISGGVVTAHNWLAVGREGGHGILNISGGSITKDGNGNISICHGGGAQGTVNQTGGSFTCAGGETWIGEDSGPGIWNISAGTATFGYVQLARNGNATGTLNLNGGTVTAGEITTGSSGTSTINFDGGTLAANASTVNFLHGLTAANVKSGGVVIDSGSNTISIAQSLLDNGDGSLTKIGNGTLYLNGANTYTAFTLVNAGALGGAGSIASHVNVASGATLAPGTASIGTLTINNSLAFAPGSKAAVKISMDGGATNDVVGGLTSVSYAGNLTVTNVGASPLVVGAQFQLFNAASPSGNFANAASVTILPAGAGTFSPATGKLTITSAGGAVIINPVKTSGGNLILTGTGGTPGAAYTWLTTTNLANPVATWTTNLQSVFDGAGAFSNAVPITTSTSAQFFRLRTP